MKQMIVDMSARILFSLLFLLVVQSLFAQDPVNCNYLLEDAREAYDEGMVELVPELLLECIRNNGLTGEARKDAYKLVINSYLFDYLPAEADSLMDDFVREFPEYRAERSDPQEFVFLLDDHLIALGIDPYEIPEDTAIVETSRERTGYFSRRVLTKGAGEYGNTLGFNIGSPLSYPTTIEPYSLGDPTRDDGHFGLLPGFLAGAEANLIIHSKMEVSFGLLYYLTRFSYSATPVPSVSYRYVETQNQVMLPLSVIYKFNPENMKVCYYLRGGISPSYLFSATGEGKRSSGSSEDETVVEQTDITEMRTKLNMDVLLGGGARIPLNKSFIFAEIRLSSRILQVNQGEDRYQNSDLSWMLYHVDSDFLIHQLSICGGICWDLTKE